MSQRCLNCARTVEPATITTRVGGRAVTTRACPHCTSSRVVDDQARSIAGVRYGGAA